MLKRGTEFTGILGIRNGCCSHCIFYHTPYWGLRDGPTPVSMLLSLCEVEAIVITIFNILLIPCGSSHGMQLTDAVSNSHCPPIRLYILEWAFILYSYWLCIYMYTCAYVSACRQFAENVQWGLFDLTDWAPLWIL